MRSTEGFYLVHRSIDDTWMYGDGYAQLIFIKLIGWAKYRDQGKKVRVNGKFVSLERGQLVTSVKEIEKATGWSKRVIDKRLTWFEMEQQIVQQKGNKGRVITIVNYDKFQLSADDEGKQKGNKGETKVKQRGNKGEHKNEDNEVNQGNEDIYTPPNSGAYEASDTFPPGKKNLPKKKAYDENDELLAEKWARHASEIQPWAKHQEKIANFAEGIAHVRKQLDLVPEEMAALFNFICKHAFWHNKAISPKALMNRSEKSGLRKIDHILQDFKQTWQKAKAMEDWLKDDSTEIDYEEFAKGIDL